jgi:transposase
VRAARSTWTAGTYLGPELINPSALTIRFVAQNSDHCGCNPRSAKSGTLSVRQARGKPREDDRRIISGIIHILKSGCRWKDCPEAYGPPTTIYNRFARWARRGIWENLFRAIAANGRSADTQMIDSTHVKAHRSASGGKGGRRDGRRYVAFAKPVQKRGTIENAAPRGDPGLRLRGR